MIIILPLADLSPHVDDCVEKHLQEVHLKSIILVFKYGTWGSNFFGERLNTKNVMQRWRFEPQRRMIGIETPRDSLSPTGGLSEALNYKISANFSFQLIL